MEEKKMEKQQEKISLKKQNMKKTQLETVGAVHTHTHTHTHTHRYFK